MSLASFIFGLLILSSGGQLDTDSRRGSIPILYSTDLYHPHADPDDHFDLATLFALPEFDIRGVILDDGARQKEAPGRIPLEQMLWITQRRIPYAIGLAGQLRSAEDTGLGQPDEFQQGVRLLLEALRQSPVPVTVFCTGSLRDVAAALNREPELLRTKISRLYLNIGDTTAQDEYNVLLDPQAYVAVLRSKLPIYWCPCFDGGLWRKDRGYATYWRFIHYEVLEATRPVVQNWFIYALTKPQADPIAFLSQPADPTAKKEVWAMPRNMWCTAPFLHAAGRSVIREDSGRWQIRTSAPEATARRLFDFVDAKVSITPEGRAHLVLDPQADGEPVKVFKILEPELYDTVMTEVLRELLRRL